MRGASKVVMGATVAMAVSLLLVLGLVLALLAELYCALFSRRRRHGSPSSVAATATVPASPFSSGGFHLQDGFDPQRSPRAKPEPEPELEPRLPIVEPPHSEPEPQSILEASPQVGPDKSFRGGEGERLVYISNPVYDDERSSPGESAFETPRSSPSQLVMGGSTGEEAEGGASSPPPRAHTSAPSPLTLAEEVSAGPASAEGSGGDRPSTAPLTAEAWSVSSNAVRLVDVLGGDRNGNGGTSSSSSGGQSARNPR